MIFGRSEARLRPSRAGVKKVQLPCRCLLQVDCPSCFESKRPAHRQISSFSADNKPNVNIDGLIVVVERKRVKNVNLRLSSPAGHIHVSAPLGTSDSYIFSFVRQKRAWIDEKLKVIKNSIAADAEGATSVQIEKWYGRIKVLVPPLLTLWEPVIGVKAVHITYRNMTSRWGSCQPLTGRITINVRLALYPPECLEYVVVHELCHLRQTGHGPRFKNLMDTFLPNWRELRTKLR